MGNFFSDKQFKIIKDRKEAILTAIQNAYDSIILILGKGIEEYQIIGEDKIPHSDIQIIKNYIYENRD